MFAVTVAFTAKPEAASAFRARVLRQAADSLRLEPGCRRFDVLIDDARPLSVFLYEIYDDAAAFDAHLASAHYASFAAESAPMVADKRVERWRLA